jgi:hypothetical protein
MVQWFIDNKTWLFSGIGGVALIAVINALKREKVTPPSPPVTTTQTVTQTVTLVAPEGPPQPKLSPADMDQEAQLKERTRILFVDDDRRFKIVSLLRKLGWSNVEIVSDIQRLDVDKLKLADIVFLDIQGVGRRLGFADEGLGLARAIRHAYPEKKIVIYSAVTGHDPFAPGFRVADDRLSKNAEPYEFEKTILDLLS